MNDSDTVPRPGMLPLGYLSLDGQGVVRRYNPFAADTAIQDPDAVVGRSFFRDLFEPSEIGKLEQRFRRFVDGDEGPSLSANIDLKRGRRVRRVHVGFVRSPLKDEVIVTVNAVGHEDLPLSAQVRPDPVHGTLLDAAGQMVVVANEDFWQAMESALAGADDGAHLAALERLGSAWGSLHAQRVEAFVQRESSQTLGELQIQIALEYLSGSLAIIGLGNFQTDFSRRQRGVVIIDHRSSPFPSLARPRGECCCHLLAGFHAGLLSYLSGRTLHGHELFCATTGAEHCRFLIATEARLAALRAAEPHPNDAKLLAALGRPSDDGSRAR
jgi:predicted hydrocarbon binding protein